MWNPPKKQQHRSLESPRWEAPLAAPGSGQRAYIDAISETTVSNRIGQDMLPTVVDAPSFEEFTGGQLAA